MPRKTIMALLAVCVLGGTLLGAQLGMFNIETPSGFLFDVMLDSSMALSNGLDDAYDGCYAMRVGGTEFTTSSAAVLFAGRGVQSPRNQVGNLRASRQVYVPRQGDWARYYDLVVNEAPQPRTVDVEILCNLGSDSGTRVTSSSDGDQIAEATDQWLATDDYAEDSGDPSLAHVIARSGAKTRPTSVTLMGDELSFRYQVKLGARAKAAIVFFAVQTRNSTEAARLAKELVGFPSAASAELSREDIRLVVN